MTTRKAKTITKAQAARLADQEVYEVLSEPDHCSYLFGRLTHSYDPALSHLPLIVSGDLPAALLDERCVVRIAQTGAIVYWPACGAPWYERHPCHQWPWLQGGSSDGVVA